MRALHGGPSQGPMPHRMDMTPAKLLACISGAPSNDNRPFIPRRRITGPAITLLIAGRLVLGAGGIGLIAVGAALLGIGR
jgi:hypothetical protein